MADVVYNKFKAALMSGTYNLSSGGDVIKIALVTSAYTPDIDVHDFFDDITNEVTGTGYTAKGKALVGQTVSQDNTDDEGVFDGNDINWSTSTITARGAVVYQSKTLDNSSALICYFDFGSDYSSNNGNFTIQWAAEGIINIG